jgi:hypothetical protein
VELVRTGADIEDAKQMIEAKAAEVLCFRRNKN